MNKAYAQPTWTLDPFGKEKKPVKFEERKLGSERTADKKFTRKRHFLQNTVTHYNYYFNANNKLNTVVDKAKSAQKDDYSHLLSFYPYSLENTLSQKQDLDSVIYKCTAGILLHDLRNDWIDNLYLLIGKSYFYRKEFDSAANTFQFINYNLFPRKKNEDDNRIVGTNESSISSNISIANKEKRNFLQKIASLPPSRNDALIWLARTLTEQDNLGEAGGLLNTLQNDINLPHRLKNDLEEVQAYWFFKQNIYDSAAKHLEKALSNADTKQDMARWEFLLAQLYEMSHNFDNASDYYARASRHTTDPVMDIFAQLNDAKMLRGTNSLKELDNSITNLVKMGRKDKFDIYRDIIYYSAGQLNLQKPDSTVAVAYFKKSLIYNENNLPFKNKTFLQLGDIAYNQRSYRQAYAWYDSLQTGDTTLASRLSEITARRSALEKIVAKIMIIEREDSLQKIAAMTANDRDIYIKKLLKRLRKEQGLKDEENNNGSSPISFNNNTLPVDLFGSNTKGEWYFYNAAVKSRGAGEFKVKWGDRTNIDNWRRKSAAKSIVSNPAGDIDGALKTDSKSDKKTDKTSAVLNGNTPVTDLSYDGLLKDLPLTPEKIGNSNDMISGNLLQLAKIYQDDLEDYRMAADTYEEYLRRFPDRLIDGEAYLGLYYSYSKLGDINKASYYKNLLNTKFADTKFGKMALNPASLNPKTKDPQATMKYEFIYNLFIEGKFTEALSSKKSADSIYGNNYWTPQLLYIEAVYYVKERKDSLAVLVLNSIIKGYPKSGLKDKAANLKEVLSRRKEIEDYLNSLQVTRASDNKVIITEDKTIVKKPPVSPPATQPTSHITSPALPVIKDSTKKTMPVITNGIFTLNPSAPHVVIMILDKVDQVYVTESKNAFARYNRENFSNLNLELSKDILDPERNLIVFSSFPNADAAIGYYDKLRRAASTEVSWLSAAKYSFLVITPENLQILKANKNILAYKTFLNSQYPGKF